MITSRLHRRITIASCGITLLIIILACRMPFQPDVTLSSDPNLATDESGTNDIPSKVLTEVAATLFAPQQATFTSQVVEAPGATSPAQAETQTVQKTEFATATSSIPSLSTAYPTVTSVTFSAQTGKDINITALYLNTCGGLDTAYFLVENTGTQPIESLSLQLIDLNANQDISDPNVTNMPFLDSDSTCVPGSISELEPGKSLFVVGTLGSDRRSGYTIQANLFFCTQDELNGQCYPRSVEFVMP